jgi:hypothetical protein
MARVAVSVPGNSIRLIGAGFCIVQGHSVGHEIIVYRGRSVIVHGLDLWAIRHFMLVEAEAARRDELVAFIRGWEWIGSGVYLGIEFDDFFGSHPEQQAQFIELSSSVEQRLDTFGSHVPLDYLQENVNTAMVFFKAAQPIERWKRQIENICGLLNSA